MQTMYIAFIACSLAKKFFIRNWMAYLGDDVLNVCSCVCWGHLIIFMFQMVQTYVAHIYFNFENPACFGKVGDSNDIVRGPADKGWSPVFVMF